MKHTIKLLTLVATLVAVIGLTGCPKPVGEIDDEPIEVVHEHSWGEGVITTKPTCTNKGVRTFTCECGAKRTEEVAPLGHDFQGGYCERCGEYEFEDGYKLTFYVCTKEKYETSVSKKSKSGIWDEVYFSFTNDINKLFEMYPDTIIKLGSFDGDEYLKVYPENLLHIKNDYENISVEKWGYDSSCADTDTFMRVELSSLSNKLYVVIK